MKMFPILKNRFLTLLLMIGAAGLLSSCGESTNLKNPNSGGPVTTCSQLANVTCVNGRFTADAVANLNYECGTDAAKISGVTAVDGGFSCPVNTPVTFSLVNPDTSVAADKRHKIVLGTTTVKMPAEIGQSNGNLIVNTLFYVTPTTLSGGSTATAVNITRLLQGLRDSSDGRAVDDAARRVVIDDLYKRQLKEPYLTTDVTAADFLVMANLQLKLNGWLTQIGKGFASEPDATATLKKSGYGTVSGIYFVPGAVSALTQSGADSACQDTPSYFGGFCGFNNGNVNYFIGAVWGMVDRAGRVFGFGTYSEGPRLPASSTVSQSQWDACKLLFRVGDPAGAGDAVGCQTAQKQQPDRLPLAMKDPSSGLWPVWNDDGQWNFSYRMLNAAGADLSTPRALVLSGIVDRDAVAGSSSRYRTIYHNEDPVSSAMGKWSEGANYLQTNTRYTLIRARPIAPTLDPSFWCEDTDADCSIAARKFPINVVFKFYSLYKDPAAATTCATATDPTCLVGTLHASILRDGNVVTNLVGNCGVVNGSTLVGSLGQDYPVGVVAQAYRGYASFMLAIPYRTDVAAFSGIRGVQVGTTTASTTVLPVRLRIAKNATMAVYSEYTGSSGSYTPTDTDIANSARWVDQHRVYQGDQTSYGTLTAELESTTMCP